MDAGKSSSKRARMGHPEDGKENGKSSKDQRKEHTMSKDQRGKISPVAEDNKPGVRVPESVKTTLKRVREYRKSKNGLVVHPAAFDDHVDEKACVLAGAEEWVHRHFQSTNNSKRNTLWGVMWEYYLGDDFPVSDDMLTLFKNYLHPICSNGMT